MTILLFLYKDKEERPPPTNSTDLYNFHVKCKFTLDEEVEDLNKLPQPTAVSSTSYQHLLSKL